MYPSDSCYEEGKYVIAEIIKGEIEGYIYMKVKSSGH